MDTARRTHPQMPRFLARVRSRQPEGAARTPLRTPRPGHAEGRRGPGWFDSSWDLQQGLEVREGLPADARLNEWLEACLLA